MDFSFTEEQELLRRTVREFAQRELAPIARRIDETEEFPWESIPKLASIGLFGVGIEQEYGGSGGGYTETAIVAEEISYTCASTCVIWGVTTSLAGQAIQRFGSPGQKSRFLLPLAKGQKLGAFALTEPGSGSDAASLQTSARRDGSSYVLNGSKVFISSGDVADTIVLFATVDRRMRDKGITAFIIEKGTPGLSAQKQHGKLGIRGSSTAQLFLEECRVPVENRLGEEGIGFNVALGTIDSSRIMIAAQAVGIAQASLDAAIKYAKERQQFGKPIAEFQGIQWMLADMATRIDAARLLTYRAAYIKDKGLPPGKESAMAKLFAAEMAVEAATKAVQIYGGYGYFKDSPVERYFRDAKITEIYEGTSEIQRLVIARHLLSQA